MGYFVYCKISTNKRVSLSLCNSRASSWDTVNIRKLQPAGLCLQMFEHVRRRATLILTTLAYIVIDAAVYSCSILPPLASARLRTVYSHSPLWLVQPTDDAKLLCIAAYL